MKKWTFVLALAMCVVLGCGCGTSRAPKEKTGGDQIEVFSGDIPEDSILYFQGDEGAARLMADMAAGRVPSECTAMFDEMGSRPFVTVTDPETIEALYARLTQMRVGPESPWSVTDAYHSISFTLQDGTTVGWHFETADLLCWGYKNYEAYDGGSLWSLVRELQDEL